MELIKLDNVTCKYDAGKSKFVFSWDRPETNKALQKIGIAEISDSDSGKIKEENILWANISPSSVSYSIRYNNESNMHTFIVVGIADYISNDETVSRFRIACRNFGIDRITYTGYSGAGKLFWRENLKNNIMTVLVNSSTSIPTGLLCYSYTFCGVRFLYRIYRPIIRSESYSHIITFYLPDGASNFKLEIPDSSVVCRKYSEKEKKGCFAAFFSTLFGKKEN